MAVPPLTPSKSLGWWSDPPRLLPGSTPMPVIKHIYANDFFFDMPCSCTRSLWTTFGIDVLRWTRTHPIGVINRRNTKEAGFIPSFLNLNHDQCTCLSLFIAKCLAAPLMLRFLRRSSLNLHVRYVLCRFNLSIEHRGVQTAPSRLSWIGYLISLTEPNENMCDLPHF